MAEKRKKTGRGLKKILLSAAGVLVLGGAAKAEEHHQDDNSPDKAQKVWVAPTRTVDYQVDTLAKKDNTLAYFQYDKNTITSNYVRGEDLLNKEAQS